MRVTAWAVGTLGQVEAGAQPAWRALRHEDYRAWADESLGDQRQVVHGYGVVVMDSRGIGRSPGVLDP